MQKILLSITIIFLIGVVNAQNITQQQLNFIHKKSKSLLEEYEQYFNLVGDVNEPHADREGIYIPSFVGLFIDETAIHYNDLDPEEETSKELPVNQYASNTILWYTSGVINMLDLSEIGYGKPQNIEGNSYYINLYVNRTIKGIFMEKKVNRSTTKLEFRISFDSAGRLFNNFRIAGINLASDNIILDNSPSTTIENNNKEVVDNMPYNDNKLYDFIGNSGSFTDSRDGQLYKWVRIGNQIWMAENLNHDTNNSFCYDNNEGFCDKYGRLYIWDAVKIACPDGWHLPTDKEWQQLEVSLGMSKDIAATYGWRGTDEGQKLKSTSGWQKQGDGSNSSGFNALPGGRLNGFRNGKFTRIGERGYWWSSTQSQDLMWSWAWRIDNKKHNVNQMYYASVTPNGFSIRCVKD